MAGTGATRRLGRRAVAISFALSGTVPGTAAAVGLLAVLLVRL